MSIFLVSPQQLSRGDLILTPVILATLFRPQVHIPNLTCPHATQPFWARHSHQRPVKPDNDNGSVQRSTLSVIGGDNLPHYPYHGLSGVAGPENPAHRLPAMAEVDSSARLSHG